MLPLDQTVVVGNGQIDDGTISLEIIYRNREEINESILEENSVWDR